MNNQQRKYIPASDALPTKNYWIAFIIVAIILCIVNRNNVRAEIANYNDHLLLADISEAQEEKLLNLAVFDSVIGSVIACAWGIILNIALRYKTWRWRWVLIYAVTVTVLCIGISSLVNGKLTAASVGWLWWIVIGLYRREYVNNHLLFKPTRDIPKQQNSPTQTFAQNPNLQLACPICGKVGLPSGNKCAFCGEVLANPYRKKETARTSHPAEQSKSLYCTKCGRKLQPEDKFCDFCGTAADTEKPQDPQSNNFEVCAGSDVSIPPVENFDSYYTAHYELLNKIAPLTVSEQYSNYWTKPRKRIEFECKCFMAFMHYLATREDKYSEINSISYMNKLLLHISEKETFDRRIGDYLEIDLFEKTLPSLDVLLEKLDPLDAENAKKCDAINYIYAFSAFAKNAKHYAVSRDFKEIANLIDAVSINFFNDDLAQIFTSSINVYNKLKNCTIPPENKQPQNLNNAK